MAAGVPPNLPYFVSDEHFLKALLEAKTTGKRMPDDFLDVHWRLVSNGMKKFFKLEDLAEQYPPHVLRVRSMQIEAKFSAGLLDVNLNQLFQKVFQDPVVQDPNPDGIEVADADEGIQEDDAQNPNLGGVEVADPIVNEAQAVQDPIAVAMDVVNPHEGNVDEQLVQDPIPEAMEGSDVSEDAEEEWDEEDEKSKKRVFEEGESSNKKPKVDVKETEDAIVEENVEGDDQKETSEGEREEEDPETDSGTKPVVKTGDEDKSEEGKDGRGCLPKCNVI